MKKLFRLFFAAGFAACAVSAIAFSSSDIYAAADSTQKLTESCRSCCLADAYSGEIVYEENAHDRMPIASVCKVMTLTLCFEAIEQGKLQPDQMITVSDRAAGMGGSQVFLQSGLEYPLSELIKSIIVCSANDSCVAVSESIAGSEEQFVAKMNERAEQLGCKDTLFANCTGLPKDTQYSCAADVAVMFANLIKHEDYFKYSKIWLEDFAHPDNRTTSMTNTNKLIKKYSFCDGGKTGFTNEAGFCLAATAKKDNLRLVSVVLGGQTSDNRFSSVVNLFNYGFANFANKIVLDKSVNLNEKASVKSGKKEAIAVRPERNCYVFSRSDQAPEITFSTSISVVKAPVKKGDKVGQVEVYKNGVICDTVNLVAAEDALKANYADNLKKIADNWCM